MMIAGRMAGLGTAMGLILMAIGAPVAYGAASGADYNITLVSDSTPDLTDIDSYLHSITSQYATPQEQAIAIWRWSQRLRKQTTNPVEDGQVVLDPIQMFNSYGYCNCGIISGVNNALWLKMGWKAHYVQLGDHTVCECSWDGGKSWHMFDSSMSFYCFNDQGEVASVREIEKNPRFYLENFAPECGTNPVGNANDHRGWRCASDGPVRYQRTLANGYDSFKPPNDVSDGNLYAQWGKRYVLNLRPAEHYTRYFQPVDGGGARTFRPVRENQDVDANKNIRANGVWQYAPDLRDPATREGVYSESGVSWTKEGIKGPGQVIFKVSAANVVTSAKLSMRADGAMAAISRDAGINWDKVALKAGSAQCQEQVAGVTEYLVKVELSGPQSLLSAIAINTITQVNRPALPRLTRGQNRIQVRLGQQVETIQFQPSVVAGQHKKTVYAEKGIDVESDVGFYKPTLRPAEKAAACYATWKIAAPTPITDLVFGGTICVKAPNDRVTLLHSWDDQTYHRDYQKTDDSMPWDRMVDAAVTLVPAEARTAYLRYEFQTERAPKNYFGPGIQMAMMTVHHRPRTAEFAPIEVTYCWIEHRTAGDVQRQHTELVTAPEREYTINVGGFRDPTMQWVRMNLKGSGPDGPAVGYGYADGQDVGGSPKAGGERYRWGKNLALGKRYTLEGAQDQRNPDGGSDLTDGIIAPPDTYVSVKYMPTNVMFTKDVSPVMVLDLGESQRVSAVRVHAGQAEDFHLSFPDVINVETSADGRTFAPAGSAAFGQVFDPPADYVPWELDESTLFKNLPAGGRLAYAYRIIFEKPISTRYVRIYSRCRAGWGMLLSEVQVFDTVMVEKNLPPLVVHRPITGHWAGQGEVGAAAVDLRPNFARWELPLRLQGARGTCSVFAMTGAMEYAWASHQGRGMPLSQEFLNWASNQAIKIAADGGFFSDLWKGYLAYGICAESLMPYQATFDAKLRPNEAALRQAEQIRQAGLRLHWIKPWDVKTGLTAAEFGQIKKTLEQNWPVCGGLRWPKREQWQSGVLAMAKPEDVFDGHSILLVGFRDDPTQPGGGVFFIRNSGGGNHDAAMSYEYVRAYMNDAVWIDIEGTKQ